MNRMYLTSLGYISLGEAKTSGYSFRIYREDVFREEIEQILKGNTKFVDNPFNQRRNEEVALPLRFIFGENIDI